MNKKARLFAVCGILLLAVLLAAPALAAPKVVARPRIGPPNKNLRVIGTGFNAFEAVDVFFDSTDLFLAATDDTGRFTASIRAPRAAAPGIHWITAIGRNSHLAAQKSFRVRTDWAQYRNGPRHTGFNPYENVLTRASVGGLGLAWTMPSGGPNSSSPAVADGKVFVGGNDGHLYHFNATTGVPLAGFDVLGAIGSSPAVVGHNVYFFTDDHLYAYNHYTGLRLFPSKYFYAETLDGSPAVANGVVYFGSESGKLYAYNATTGDPLPGWPVSTNGRIRTSPAVANGVVYAYSYGDKLYAFNATSGAKLWDSQETLAEISYSSPVPGPNGVVYLPTYADGKLYAFKAADGQKLWDSGSIITHPISSSTPAVANGRVYVADNRGLYAFNAGTGALLPGWPTSTIATIESSPVVAKGVVYVGDNFGCIYAFHAVSGALLWQGETAGWIATSPAVADGTLYVSSKDLTNSYLSAFNLDAGLETMKATGAQKGVPRPDPAVLEPDYRLPLPDFGRKK